ncbi:MAG: hypothetical protein V1794_07575, partial [Candidatus Glassbacteria bacterium]
GPWPGERPREFYRDLLARPETYVRSAGESLARIAAEKLIRASSWKMPSGEPAVGFTALPAGRCIELMTWRRSLARYSFEPFGVAVRTAELVRLGCRPVKYFTEGSTRPAGPDLPFTQGEGKTAAWSREEEWRTRGDLNLAGLDAESVLLVACTREDTAYINSKCRPPWPIVHLFE